MWLKYVLRGAVVLPCFDVGYEQKVASAKVWNFEELHSRAWNLRQRAGGERFNILSRPPIPSR